MPLRIIKEWKEASQDLDNIAEVIIQDLCPLLNTPEGAPHTISREFSCYIDYLGALYCGTKKNKNGKEHLEGSGKRFINYLKDVMYIADPGYNKQAETIYEMYRCGAVHEFDPKVLSDPSGKELHWFEYRGARKQYYEEWRKYVDHLKPVLYPEDSKVYYLPVSTICLAQDLLYSIEQFKHFSLKSEKCLIEHWNEAARLLNAPKGEQMLYLT